MKNITASSYKKIGKYDVALFYGTLQWESQYVEPLYSRLAINLSNSNLRNTDLSGLLCLFLSFIKSELAGRDN